VTPITGPALALAAACRSRLFLDGRSEDAAAGVDLARRALQVAGDHPGVLVDAAIALAAFGEDIGTMIALVDRALALNPSFARGWYASGVLRNWAGQPDVAIEHAQNSLRLSPRVRVGNSLRVIAVAHFIRRRFGDATAALLLAIQDDPRFADTYRWLAACYSHMGRLGEARETIERLKRMTPVVTPPTFPLRIPEHRELFFSGLRLADGETK
jgi:adenylate cyclase